MITCQDIIDHAPSYQDGDLPLSRRVGVALHLMMCSACRGYVKQVAALRRALGSLPAPSPADPARQAMRERFHATA